ncbi:hypothetical protein EV424DRAFT_397294 [Suillus variegatus]|nr:hypothetical protein EV424DRAFT_397294 [Suillus variegatus]
MSTLQIILFTLRTRCHDLGMTTNTAKSKSKGFTMENSTPSIPSGSRETVAEGPVSLVSKSLLEYEGQTQWIAIKTSTIHREYAKEPHDIIKEARLIASACHPNAIASIQPGRP